MAITINATLKPSQKACMPIVFLLCFVRLVVFVIETTQKGP